MEEKLWARRSIEEGEEFKFVKGDPIVGSRIGRIEAGELTTSRYVARWLATAIREKKKIPILGNRLQRSCIISCVDYISYVPLCTQAAKVSVTQCLSIECLQCIAIAGVNTK